MIQHIALPLSSDFLADVKTLLDSFHYMFIPEEKAVYRELLSRAEKSEERLFFADIEEEKIAGCILAQRPADSHYIWEVKLIVVNAEDRGKGKGAQLLDAVEQHLRQMGVATIFLETAESDNPLSIQAVHFYQKHGFMKAGVIPEYWGPNDDKVIFCKKLM